jgi:tRNA(Ile2)-agmatinylcytidine synthase
LFPGHGLTLLHIGIDDTDSPRGGCTTYIAALLAEKLSPHARFVDYPSLVRLNPNIEWKTRGNGAVCLRVEADDEDVPEMWEIVLSSVEENADIGYARTDPAVVVLKGEVPNEVLTFGQRCLKEVATKSEALKILRRCRGEAVAYGTGRGLIGALAATGNLLTGDHTYEFIAYRASANRGTVRSVDRDSVLRMDAATKGRTFSNVDDETKRILITPRGRDPVLVGIRGESQEGVAEAFLHLSFGEEVERWCIFRTNQGTEAHHPPIGKASSAKPHYPAALQGVVSKAPTTIPGGHVIFELADGSGSVPVAAYEPSGSLRTIARELRVGDLVRVYGGVRPSHGPHPVTVNLEKLEVMELAPEVIYRNPPCPSCGRHMESMGVRQGYRCRRCGVKDIFGELVATTISRTVEPGLYLPPQRSQRHLSKPMSRYGLERPYIQLAAPKRFWGLGSPERSSTGCPAPG